MPAPSMLERMAEKTPAGFLFAVKAFQGITHEREDGLKLAPEFTEALASLRDAGKLGAVLAQFPYSFHPTEENRDYLMRLREGFGPMPVVVQFRDVKWANEDTFDILEELGFGYCCVDEPRLKGLMPPIAVAAGPVFYLRLHGRNASKWWQHKEARERYDYTYKAEELEEWVPKLQALDQHGPLTLVYANNHWSGQAVSTASCARCYRRKRSQRLCRRKLTRDLNLSRHIEGYSKDCSPFHFRASS
jgi:uncharacterized protein YecE (DUF72 family)